MNEHKTFVLNTEDTFNKLQEASEKKAETLFRYRKLEKSEKIILAKLKNELRLNHDKITQVELTDNAYREPRYKEWLIAFTQAEKDFSEYLSPKAPESHPVHTSLRTKYLPAPYRCCLPSLGPFASHGSPNAPRSHSGRTRSIDQVGVYAIANALAPACSRPAFARERSG